MKFRAFRGQKNTKYVHGGKHVRNYLLNYKQNKW